MRRAQLATYPSPGGSFFLFLLCSLNGAGRCEQAERSAQCLDLLLSEAVGSHACQQALEQKAGRN
jgi:hypothetical protein